MLRLVVDAIVFDSPNEEAITPRGGDEDAVVDYASSDFCRAYQYFQYSK
jgi:hypothetical protein